MHFLTSRLCSSSLGHGHFNMFVQLRCSSQITPKYLTSVTRFVAEPLIVTENWFFLPCFCEEPNSIASVFNSFRSWENTTVSLAFMRTLHSITALGFSLKINNSPRLLCYSNRHTFSSTTHTSIQLERGSVDSFWTTLVHRPSPQVRAVYSVALRGWRYQMLSARL